MIATKEQLQKKLKEQHDQVESWDHDPITHTVLKILSGPLNDENYKNCETAEAKRIVEDNLNGISAVANTRSIGRIIRKVKSLSTTTEVVLYLGELLIND